jgi:hypothetical protein
VTSTDGEDKSVCVSWGKFGFAEFSCASVPADEFSGGSGKWKVQG